MRLERRVLVLQRTGLFTGAAFCGCLIAPATIQCVIQNCWWEALLLAGWEPSLIHEILLAVDSMHQVSPGPKPQGSRGRRLCGLFFFNLHFSRSYPLSSLGLVQAMRLTPTFLKNIIYLLFELYTQVSYKWRVTAIRKNKGVCWAVINNKLPRKNASPTLGFVLLWLSTIFTKFWQSHCHYLFMMEALGTCSAHSESPLCTY